jgi:hypothetical protein
MDIHEQVLTCQVESKTIGSPWALSVVYGAPQGLDRRGLLERLKFLKLSVGFLPWLIAGDFNVVRATQKKWGSVGLNCYEKDFGDCILSLEVDDLAYSSSFHTWTNKQAGSVFVAMKLDRVIPLWNFWKEVYLIILLPLFLLQSMLAMGLNLLSFLIFGLNMLNS